jgi:hypothetical protein
MLNDVLNILSFVTGASIIHESSREEETCDCERMQQCPMLSACKIQETAANQDTVVGLDAF